MSEPLAAIGGAVAAAVAALLGFVGTRRSQHVDALSRMLVEVREWADDFRSAADQARLAEERCQTALAAVRNEVAALRRRLDAVQDRVSDIEPDDDGPGTL